MASPRNLSLEHLAIPAVSTLIIFLAYTSQYLFHYTDPGPLSRKESVWFNTFLLAIWWSYYNACTTDPGPRGWVNTVDEKVEERSQRMGSGSRWCKKCDNVKPSRAHHCKKCQRYTPPAILNSRYILTHFRCIPKMDHHCPWTTNCVSHTTFPHFIRFVFYTVLCMSILSYHLFVRCQVIWANRALPAYLGPPLWAIAHLLVLVVINGITLFALGILLVRALYSMAANTTMIEEWEIERHEALVERARKTGGFVYASGGQRMRIHHQEFPYDIGIWQNLCQAMGTGNVPLWFMPFAGSPSTKTALEWEENGFEDAGLPWPPPDPDKMPRKTRTTSQDLGKQEYSTNEDRVTAFQKRQRADLKRRGRESSGEGSSDAYASDGEEENMKGRYWTNSEGDRLEDYGVEEETEMLEEDEVPLGELLQRRKGRASS